MRRISFVVLALGFCAAVANCHVRMPAILGSHMVIQRDEPVHLWGWASPGEKVTVELNGANASAQADANGRWSVYLPPQHASASPVTINIRGNNTLALEDILIGDVWFASGQSNMQMPLSGWPNAVLNNSAQEIQNANHPQLRLFSVKRALSSFPQQDFQGSWAVCNPQTVSDFSAAAYFFGRAINADEHVPVGLVHSSWGGTPAESWVSMETLGSDAALMPVFASWAHLTNEGAYPSKQKSPEWEPSTLYNAMVAPAVGLRIKGVIWYQGESNSGSDRAPLYHELFSKLIQDWRMHWGEGYFPFLFVQLATYKPGANWSVVQDAQRRTLQLVNTGMAVTNDIGDPANVHPADKQDVGERLALAARAIAYGEKIEYSGPLYQQTSIEGQNLRVWFTHTSGGLKAKNGALQGFEVAGDDGKFVPATAAISGDTVLVHADSIAAPKYVRYGWGDVPGPNLANGAGLPASVFTSEP